VGGGYRGDIAIDDISLPTGLCPPSSELTQYFVELIKQLFFAIAYDFTLIKETL